MTQFPRRELPVLRPRQRVPEGFSAAIRPPQLAKSKEKFSHFTPTVPSTVAVLGTRGVRYNRSAVFAANQREQTQPCHG